MEMNDMLKGAIYGALIGDAVGVPYEFKAPHNIPPYDQIDMVPPDGYKRSWSKIPIGTYSDDGAQVLCLLEHLTTRETFDATIFHTTLCDWYHHGYMACEGLMFDAGNQTIAALTSMSPQLLNEERFNGNGSLMRAIPVALTCKTPHDVCSVAFQQSCATHPHIRSRLCCAWYCLIGYYLLEGQSFISSVIASMAFLNKWIVDTDTRNEWLYVSNYGENQLTGSGYVVDSLLSALNAVGDGTSYEDTIKLAITYGNDTDTTACIAGGLAGIIYGYGGIPQNWIDVLRDKEHIDSVIAPLLNVAT